MKLVRSFRPQVMTTYDEKGGYPHPDHIRCHVISVAAYRAAGDPDAYPDAGEPWEVSKLYYNVGFSLRRMKAINDAVGGGRPGIAVRGVVEAVVGGGWPDSYERATTHIPVAGFFEKRDAALRAHATQIDPDAHWFAVPYELEAEVWPTEEYELAESRVHRHAGGRSVRRDSGIGGRVSTLTRIVLRLADDGDIDPGDRPRAGMGQGRADRAADHRAARHRAGVPAASR